MGKARTSTTVRTTKKGIRMSVIYVASPYTGTTQERQLRFEAVQHYTAHLIRSGKVAFSPIVHSHDLSIVHNLPGTFDFWQNYCLDLLTICDEMHLLTLPEWEKSVGVLAEVQHAIEMEIDLTYINYKTYKRV